MTFHCVSGHSNKLNNNIGFYLFIFLIISSFLVNNVSAWGSDELELFDLVEEVNQNFYELLGISQDADTKEVKKAFRKLSLVLHPDKNDSPDADVQFRQLVAVYEVLSDEQKRTRYNEVLQNGVPDWKHAVYYYRRVRKMGLAEMGVILFMIVTVGHYIVIWASYFERKYTAEQFVSSKMKKIQKKQKKGKADANEGFEEMFIDLPKPSMRDLLPCQFVRGTIMLITGAPEFYRLIQALLAERRRRKEEEEEESSEESAREDDEERKERRVRRRKAFLPPELANDENDTCILEEPDSETPAPVPRKLIVGGLWTDDDFAELAKLIKKFPGGTSERWEKIADAMNRTVPEVTHMARKVKEEHYRPTAGPTEEATIDVALKPSKVKTKGGKLGKGPSDMNEEGCTEREEMGEEFEDQNEVLDVWSQPQQKALENALIKFPKGTSERWVKIANCVPGKNMDECIMRYKQLVELVKKKKQQSQHPSGETNQASHNNDTPES